MPQLSSPRSFSVVGSRRGRPPSKNDGRSCFEEANEYFATSPEIVPDEWPVLLYIRTYFAFKSGRLSAAARQHLGTVLKEYKRRFDGPESKGIERHGTRGNHSIVAFSMYLLLDQEFGNGSKRDVARDKFVRWVRHQGRYGRDEVNSPHYLDRSLLPLLNIYDFINDPMLKRWARMAVDQMVTEFAVLSLDNVRGGPWCRAHHNHSPGVAEINDGTQDTFYVAGYVLFGNSPRPDYLFTDQILNYGFLVTTDYRPPALAVMIADRKTRASYEFRSHQCSVPSPPSPGPAEWDMYYYMTPLYSLGSLQDRVTLDNHVTGRATRDFKNTQVWELSFSDPMLILGPRRSLKVSTGEIKEVVETDNPNTATMQYKNVLFFKGDFMGYNGNLSAGGGTYTQEKGRQRAWHFWRVVTPDGSVCIGVTHYGAVGTGILELHRRCHRSRPRQGDGKRRGMAPARLSAA